MLRPASLIGISKVVPPASGSVRTYHKAASESRACAVNGSASAVASRADAALSPVRTLRAW